jgi:hypothetical protein
VGHSCLDSCEQKTNDVHIAKRQVHWCVKQPTTYLQCECVAPRRNRNACKGSASVVNQHGLPVVTQHDVAGADVTVCPRWFVGMEARHAATHTYENAKRVALGEVGAARQSRKDHILDTPSLPDGQHEVGAFGALIAHVLESVVNQTRYIGMRGERKVDVHLVADRCTLLGGLTQDLLHSHSIARARVNGSSNVAEPSFCNHMGHPVDARIYAKGAPKARAGQCLDNKGGESRPRPSTRWLRLRWNNGSRELTRSSCLHPAQHTGERSRLDTSFAEVDDSGMKLDSGLASNQRAT